MKLLIQKIIRRISTFLGMKSYIEKDYSLNRIIKHYLIKNNQNIVVDVGANVGQSVSRFMKLIKIQEMHVFEPQQDAMNELIKNYGNDERIKINQKALGAKKDTLMLNKTQKSATSTFNAYKTDSSFVKTKMKIHNVSNPDGLILNKVKVEVDTLDNYICSNNLKRVDLLKIDVEGFEELVLEGCIGALSNGLVKVIEIELTLDDRFGDRKNFFNIERLLVPNGYILSGFNDRYSIIERPIFQVDLLYIHNSIIKENNPKD